MRGPQKLVVSLWRPISSHSANCVMFHSYEWNITGRAGPRTSQLELWLGVIGETRGSAQLRQVRVEERFDPAVAPAPEARLRVRAEVPDADGTKTTITIADASAQQEGQPKSGSICFPSLFRPAGSFEAAPRDTGLG